MVKKTLYDIVQNEAEAEEVQQPERREEQDDENIDITPQLNEESLNRAFRGYRSPGLGKTDVDRYIDLVKPHIKTLLEQQVQELGSVKVQLTMWIKWIKKEITWIPDKKC